MEEYHEFLHGTLEISIFNIISLNPSLHFHCLCTGGENPTFIRVKVGKTKVAETTYKSSKSWYHTFRILCSHRADTVITISLNTRFSTLKKIRFPASSLLTKSNNNAFISRCFHPNVGKYKLVFEVKFIHAESELDWGKGLSEGFKGITHGVTFNQRSNCRVVLYQDTHHMHNFEPPIGFTPYKPRRLWEDVYKAIDGAKKFIYIAAWSLNPKLVLVRDPCTNMKESLGIELGELLIRKAEEGVAVRIMIWNDETSLPVIENEGIMKTHDEEALEYFKHTKVICKLCPRLNNNFPTVFSHHQKTITMDSDIKLFEEYDHLACRKVISFIGGVDLCNGRYDSEEHSLFQTLNSELHEHDFYQVNFANASLRKGGPREPWHDAHACLIGEAAEDVLKNFEQRWSKQCDPSVLVPIDFTSIGDVHQETWNVQVFRSIDHVSTSTLPEMNSLTEHSIHQAYVAAIRRAKNFIYIENQYFIGGCHLWSQDQNSGCTNLIPTEIALKICSKIRAKERFVVYIVIPMWPEGIPESETVQEMLHWTRLTMEMMYKLIGDALKECEITHCHPADYLSFFCLANREVKSSGEVSPKASPRYMSDYWKAQMNRRFMIYVHSKIMIVDDEYMIIGSANVNQRSMDGERDTEIAMGCYQPKYVMADDTCYEGDVHKYRMSLWYEHTGVVDSVFLKPQSMDCVKKLRQIGEVAWGVYSKEEIVDMGGVHLVNYPLAVDEGGSVKDLVGVFPDTNALIRGKRSLILPAIFTT